jgi:hypothetical protein
MNSVVRDLLERQHSVPRRKEFVFTSPKTGGFLTDIKHGFVAACEDAGLVDFHFHDLSHRYRRNLHEHAAY